MKTYNQLATVLEVLTSKLALGIYVFILLATIAFFVISVMVSEHRRSIQGDNISTPLPQEQEAPKKEEGKGEDTTFFML